MSTRNCLDCRWLDWEFWDLACYCRERHWQSNELERAATAEADATHLMRVAFKRAETCADFTPYEEG